jgi:CDP-diglyceride synthetase
MLVLALLIGQALGLPEVENPIPEKIGVGHIFALAGTLGLMGGIFRFRSSPSEQERAVRRGGLAGFCIGLVVYCVLSLVQVLSDL